MDGELRRINMQWSSLELSPPERALRMERETLLLIRRHWLTVIWQAAIGFGRTCFGTGFVTVRDSLSRSPGRLGTALLAGLPLVQILGMWLLATIALVRARSSGVNRAVLVLLAACVLCLIFPAASSVGQSRFRVPAAPPLSLLAGTGAALLRERKIKFVSAEYPIQTA